ncbi:hypothetical protein EVAR_103700_1 [Eumeta japonica]|uniref:Uncharacterized protein n=1 Tax=Eumeta variegata TaxID=151549 RepID=A0A4C1ZTS5_EUMVA|nr:hypothetical protein EVAR_103700_1 [Eumeta japonica]
MFYDVAARAVSECSMRTPPPSAEHVDERVKFSRPASPCRGDRSRQLVRPGPVGDKRTANHTQQAQQHEGLSWSIGRCWHAGTSGPESIETILSRKHQEGDVQEFEAKTRPTSASLDAS